MREGSGGEGWHPGSDGIIRDIEFSIPIKVSILSERRAMRPYGLEGGGDGKRGENLWIKKSGKIINLGGKNTTMMDVGDRIVTQSPGGGAWGKKDSATLALGNGLAKAKNAFIGASNGTVSVIQSMGESA